MPRKPVKAKPKKPSRVSGSSGKPIGQLVPGVPELADTIPSVRVTPIQLLAILIKVVAKDRLTKDEIDRICSTYYDAVVNWVKM
jgi:hypothetical protein